MKEEVIAIYDIGKTNKKLLLFDMDLNQISEEEVIFDEIRDDDGFECDDIEKIESWIRKSSSDLARSEKYNLRAVNFATYGATLVYLDAHGRRLTPLYNYLKPLDDEISEYLYSRYGGRDEFSRQTASPALGMLNSGLQVLWLKFKKPDVFARVRKILHFPQYLAYLLTGQAVSEHTSIGCHTAMWDFDNMQYHIWLADEGIILPQPVEVETHTETVISGTKVMVGTGLHDSSASLVPYFNAGTARFLLVSTGTWCINMNPFNEEILTAEELSRDCLCYLSITKKPVKSSRLFLGHMHDAAVKIMSEYFKIHENSFRLVKPDTRLLNKIIPKYESEAIFIDTSASVPSLIEDPELFVFDNFIEGYHKLMIELSDLAVQAIQLVIPENDDIEVIYLTGGFSKNPLFIRLVASSFPDKKVYTSEISNATALGAALITLGSLPAGSKASPDIGLIEVKY